MNNGPLRFYFDYISHNAYLAWTQIHPLAQRYGRTVEPIVCDPSARGTMRAATAAAEPLDDPPGVCSRFQGLRVTAGSAKANSVVAVFPRMTAPAA